MAVGGFSLQLAQGGATGLAMLVYFRCNRVTDNEDGEDRSLDVEFVSACAMDIDIGLLQTRSNPRNQG